MSFRIITAYRACYLMVGELVLHDPSAHAGSERRLLKNLLGQTITRMYLELDAKGRSLETSELASAEK